MFDPCVNVIGPKYLTKICTGCGCEFQTISRKRFKCPKCLRKPHPEFDVRILKLLDWKYHHFSNDTDGYWTHPDFISYHPTARALKLAKKQMAEIERLMERHCISD